MVDLEKLKVLSDDEIRLELSIGLHNSRQYYYYIYDNLNNSIGTCGIRLEDNEKNQYLGNIEYEIYPQYRGNNYALKSSRLLSQVALYYGCDKLLITANPNNLPSNKTIQNLGARFIEVRKVPKKMKLYKVSKQVNVYELDLERKSL